MLKNALFVGLGGFGGSVLRYLLYQIPVKADAIWTTWGINLIGSFVLGLIVAYTGRHAGISEPFRLFLTLGICGGFTTFSTFSSELVLLSQQGRWISFATYIAVSLLGGIFAFMAGQKCI